MAVFVKIVEFEKLSGLLDSAKNKIAAVKDTINRIEEIKQSEHQQMEAWTKEIDDVDELIGEVDKLLQSSRE